MELLNLLSQYKSRIIKVMRDLYCDTAVPLYLSLNRFCKSFGLCGFTKFKIANINWNCCYLFISHINIINYYSCLIASKALIFTARFAG